MNEIDMSLKRNSSITIDLSAIRHNLMVIRNKVAPGTKIMPVIKANAYGHGSIELANALQDDANWFAVNSVDEGIELRDAGIGLPILVFGVPDQETADLYSSYNLTATISNLEHFRLFPAGTEYHLNFNTGMGRLGLDANNVSQVKIVMENHSELMCSGIYSHFATSDNPGSSKVEEQIGRFRKICEAFPEQLLTHLSNTGGAFFYPDAAFDMVRTGIGMYGYPPGETDLGDLRPALLWKSSLVQVNPIRKGETVSYGARWEAPKDGFIGVIPVGYEDGLKRVLSGRIGFQVGEKELPQVGSITMNYCMVFLGEERLQVGTEVHLISPSANDVKEWADIADTIPYEILTSLSPDIPRFYEE